MRKKNFNLQISGAILIIFLALIVISVCCSRPDIWYKMRQGDFEIVEKGDYRGTLIYMPNPGEYEKFVSKYKKEIEKNIDLLPLMTRKLFIVEEDLVYQYKFTWLDEQNKFLVLRYFAHIYKDPVYAGYQIQFVYDTKTNKLIKIFVLNIPLE